MVAVAKLFNGRVFDKSYKGVNLFNREYKKKVIGLYFSAHWCPPCRSFTPVLVNFYLQHHQDKNFEIIFISSDQDEVSFHQYYSEMPWLALDFDDQMKKEELSNRFNVAGIPKLVLLDANSGKVLCEDARIQIQQYDPRGDYFPWKSRESGSSQNRSCTIL